MNQFLTVALSLLICLYVANCKLIELNEDNFIAIRTNIDQYSVDRVINKLFSGTDDIYIYISSNGGSVFAGNNLIDVIETLTENKIRNIICIADKAASMAFAILQSCPTRYVTKNSVLMQHQMSTMIHGSLYNINSHVDFINNIEKRMVKIQSSRLGLTEDEFVDKIAHDYWLYGEDIIDNNAADEIVHIICTSELTKQTEIIPVQNFFWMEDRVFSRCPLINTSKPVETEEDDSNNDKNENKCCNK